MGILFVQGLFVKFVQAGGSKQQMLRPALTEAIVFT